MTDEDDPENGRQADTAQTPIRIGTPTCGRVHDLAGDVVGDVMQACPRCTGTGPDCLIHLMYAEAFPSHQQH